MSKDVYILAIETSCDDTAVSIIKNGNEVLSNVVWNQNKTHQKFGGIVPELSARKHLKVINYVITEALETAEISFSELSAIAVNNQKGLIRSLVVGVSAAKSLSFALNIPLISVHHIEGHIFSNFIGKEVSFPHICLTISGGHNLLINVSDFFNYQVIGNTLDDAVGEVYDKVARVLGLSYPGGPIIDKLSKSGDENKYKFSRPMTDLDSLDFSFSGLKTEVSRLKNKLDENHTSYKIEDICASFQRAVIDTLIFKTLIACRKQNIKVVSVVGGVSANSRLRELFYEVEKKNNLEVDFPELQYTTDNAAMIGFVAYQKFINKNFEKLDLEVYTDKSLIS